MNLVSCIRTCVSFLFLLLLLPSLPFQAHAGTDVVVAGSVSNETEPSIAASPFNQNIRLVGTIEREANRLLYFYSQDAGGTWTLSGPLPEVRKTDQFRTLLPVQADPAVGFDSGGDAWYVGVATTQTSGTGTGTCDHSIFATRDRNVRGNWEAPTLVAEAGIVSGMEQVADFCHDKPSLGIDTSGGAFDGNLYVSWTRFTRVGPVGGSVFSDPTVFLTYRAVATGNWLASNQAIQLSSDASSHLSDIDVGSDGLVYVTWFSSATRALYLSRFDPTTKTVSGPFKIQDLRRDPFAGSPRVHQVQSVATDRARPEMVYVSYTDLPADTSRSDTDVFFTKSTDRGATWSAPKRVNDDPLLQTDQWMPWITTARGSTSIGIGRVDVAFYDRRSDDLNVLFETWFATSADRGETFQPNVKVSDTSYDLSEPQLREYIGITSLSKEANPVWTGKRDPFVLDSDILTDKLTFFDFEVRSFLTTGAEIASPGPTTDLDSVGGALPTPLVYSVTPGSHSVSASFCTQSGSGFLTFDHWENGSTDVTRIVNVQSDVTGNSALKAFYRKTSTCGGGGGGGCGCHQTSPYLITRNGDNWYLDNNLLPQSLDPARPAGTDVTDSYLIQQPLSSVNGRYELRIHELGLDVGYLDRVRLVTVDHDAAVKVGVTPSGQILTYQNPLPPTTATSNLGADITSLVGSMDGLYYQGSTGDSVTVEFGSADITLGAKLVVRSASLERPSLRVQVMTSPGQWSNLTGLPARTFWSINLVDLKPYLPDAENRLKVRLYVTASHRIDFIGLDATAPQQFVAQEVTLEIAIHTNGLNVTPTLLTSDDLRVQLLPLQGVKLLFTAPTQSNGTRDFIIFVEGYYEPLS